MNKQYRAELRTLQAARKKVTRDFNAVFRANSIELGKLKKAHQQLTKRAVQLYFVRDRAWEKIDRRIAILEGRLA